MTKPKTKLPPKLVKYLEERGVKHEILEHRTVYTALDVAATMRRKLNEIAKSLFIKANKDYYVVVLPADRNIDFNKLSKVIGKQTGQKAVTVKIPGEKIMENVLKVKAGTMSAFGGLHKLPVVMDKGLSRVKKAVFSAGSFNHSVEMLVRDFVALENAALGDFGKKKKIKPPARTRPGTKPKKTNRPAIKKTAKKKAGGKK
jgi:Ala-tRNA(Pro) deacylase